VVEIDVLGTSFAKYRGQTKNVEKAVQEPNIYEEIINVDRVQEILLSF
jgi:hypothetical protein